MKKKILLDEFVNFRIRKDIELENLMNFKFHSSNCLYDNIYFLEGVIYNRFYNRYWLCADFFTPENSILEQVGWYVLNFIKEKRKKKIKTLGISDKKLFEMVIKICFIILEKVIYDNIFYNHNSSELGNRVYLLNKVKFPRDFLVFEKVISSSDRIKGQIIRHNDNPIIISFIQKLSPEMWYLLS